MSRARDFRYPFLNAQRGMVDSLSEIGRRPTFWAYAENVEARPPGSVSVRPGTQYTTPAGIADKPHTLLEWVLSPGASNKYVASEHTTSGVIRRMTSSGYTSQTLPFNISTTNWLSWDQLNGVLSATDLGGGGPPFFIGPDNTAETWLSWALPKPGNTLTLTPGTGGGALTLTATYWYRLRWRYRNGSSESSAAQSVTLVAANNQVAITTIPLGTARPDYIGWTLERTRPGGDASGPFYWVFDGTATSYTDIKADGGLGYRANELLHGGVPNGHADGMIAFNDRFFVWKGSTAYVSQVIGDTEGTGFMNFDAKNEYFFGKDNGDQIQCVLKQGDRLLILKDWSLFGFEGNDLASFSVVPLAVGVGCAGPRAAACVGSVAWFYGQAGLHQIVGNDPRPFGYVEMGQVLSSIAPVVASNVVIRLLAGQRLLIAASRSVGENDTILEYDLRFRVWSGVWTGMRCRDILIQKAPSFGTAASFVSIDPVLVGGSYKPEIGYVGAKDKKASDGTGGTNISVVLETPVMDDGAPDVIKDLSRIEHYATGAGFSINTTVTLYTDTGTRVVSLSTFLSIAGGLWGDGRLWGDGSLWGEGAGRAQKPDGFPEGSYAHRFKVRVNMSIPDALTYQGFVLDGTLQPERRLT